jgi:hypothetical protein
MAKPSFIGMSHVPYPLTNDLLMKPIGCSIELPPSCRTIVVVASWIKMLEGANNALRQSRWTQSPSKIAARAVVMCRMFVERKTWSLHTSELTMSSGTSVSCRVALTSFHHGALESCSCPVDKVDRACSCVVAC